jgi:hypothetical protein
MNTATHSVPPFTSRLASLLESCRAYRWANYGLQNNTLHSYYRLSLQTSTLLPTSALIRTQVVVIIFTASSTLNSVIFSVPVRKFGSEHKQRLFPQQSPTVLSMYNWHVVFFLESRTNFQYNYHNSVSRQRLRAFIGPNLKMESESSFRNVVF